MLAHQNIGYRTQIFLEFCMGGKMDDDENDDDARPKFQKQWLIYIITAESYNDAYCAHCNLTSQNNKWRSRLWKRQVPPPSVPGQPAPGWCVKRATATLLITHTEWRTCMCVVTGLVASFSVQTYLIKKEVCWQHRIPWKTPLRIFSLRDHYKIISFSDFTSFRCVFEENEHLDSVKYWQHLFPIKMLSFRFLNKWSTSQKRCAFRPQIMGR